MTDVTYQTLENQIKALECSSCWGVGKQNDFGLVVGITNEWTCQQCQGTGINGDIQQLKDTLDAIGATTMTDKLNITIDIAGDYNSGKTQVAKIIKQALDNYGISVTVNSNENSYLEYEQFRQSNLNEACRKISQTTHVTVQDYNHHNPTALSTDSRSEKEIDALRAQLPTDVLAVGDIFSDEHDLVPLLRPQTSQALWRHPDMFPLRISEHESTSQISIKRYTVSIPVAMYPCALDEVYVVGIHSVLARVDGNEVRLLIPDGDLRQIDVSDTSYFVTKQIKIDKVCDVSFSYDNSSGLLTAYVKNVGKPIELLGVRLYGDSN